MTDLGPDARRAILDARARALSRETLPEAALPHEDRLVFRRRATTFAVPTQLVREVAKPEEMTGLPGAPSPFTGIVAIRGRIVPVVDLCLLLGESDTTGPGSYVVVLEGSGPELGVVADAVEDVGATDAGAVHPAPPALAALGFVEGVTEDGVVVLLGKKLLADRRLFVDRRSRGEQEDRNSRGT